MNNWGILLLPVVAAVAVPMMVWAIECGAALALPARSRQKAGAPRPTLTILVPAHNEARGIRRSLESIRAQMEAGDLLVVVADNCTDGTAAIARECGAIVVERCDPDRRGKSYALEFGVASLGNELTDVVILVDSDCTAQPGALCALACMAQRTGRPAQASYYLEAPPGQETRQNNAFSFFVRNVVRPAGLSKLGLPCFLNGSGMAFPSSIIRSVNWANGRLAEDRWTTVDLALAGHPPVFCEESRICSSVPIEAGARAIQHTRWIHGHLECMLLQGPRLVAHSIRCRSLTLLALALDLVVPPFSILMVMWLGSLAVTVLTALLGAGWAPAAALASCGLLTAAVYAAVERRFGNRGFRELLAATPRFLLTRTRIVAAFVQRPQREWAPTPRDAGTEKAPHPREAGRDPR